MNTKCMSVKDIIRIYPPKRVIRWVVLKTANYIPLLPRHRALFLRLTGMKIGRGVLIYKDVHFDTVSPENIIIDDNVTITSGVRILTHYLDPGQPGRMFRIGEVRIRKDAFIGAAAIICNAVTIGEGAIVGAGSVVTKSVPDYEVWAGNPARFIKKRKHS